jgi:cytochrome c oxidase cbb3-type subunit III
MSDKEIDDVTGVATTGHEWDGIKELNNPLPRWWLWTFYATIVWALAYTIAYPAWPLISSATSGMLGYSSRAEVRGALDAADAARAGYREALSQMSVDEVLADEEIRNIAVSAGAAAFRVNCVQCHGSGAAGSEGYPNLNDDSWLWGGTAQDIQQAIAHGIRYETDPQTRFSLMPGFAGILSNAEIREVASHVGSLSGLATDSGAAGNGATLYADNCASCHGASGEGDPAFGAPNLADAIWLYGSTPEAIAAQIRAPRHGMMPGWLERLGESRVKELTIYVHSLGGGE